MHAIELLPATLRDPDPAVQLARVRRLGLEALRTPGARLAGLALLLFAPLFARWFVAGVGAANPEPVNPFTYTMH